MPVHFIGWSGSIDAQLNKYLLVCEDRNSLNLICQNTGRSAQVAKFDYACFIKQIIFCHLPLPVHSYRRRFNLNPHRDGRSPLSDCQSSQQYPITIHHRLICLSSTCIALFHSEKFAQGVGNLDAICWLFAVLSALPALYHQWWTANKTSFCSSISSFF